MPHPLVTPAEMAERVVRFGDYNADNAVPLMFIDSMLPGHQRLNYAVIGDTASENPDFKPLISAAHNFQVGMFKAMPHGNGPAYHTHDYIELFLPLEGCWRFYFGNDPDGDPEGEFILEQWDLISFPPGLWRGFENIGDAPAWCFAVQEAHAHFSGKDPHWSPQVIRKAEQQGFKSDANGVMIKPLDFADLNARFLTQMMNGQGNSLSTAPDSS